MIEKNRLTPEQINAFKLALRDKLSANLNHTGPKDNQGRPIVKWAFLTKGQIRKLKREWVLNTNTGYKVYVRVF